MKKSNIFLVFFTSVMILSLGSCLNPDNKIPPNCNDGILNNGEEFIDCGGEFCDPCDPCENNQWNPELGETWVDCGGDCGVCPTNANGCMDGDETGVDCGGSTGIDCLTLCDDGLPNGFEDNAAVDCINPPGFPPDCGGPCEPCPTCTDLIMNQAEIGIDCGGSGCPACATAGNCLNGFVDGDEVYIDCAYDPDAAGFCPQCDVYITATINGVATNFDNGMLSTFVGGTLILQGSDDLTNTISISIQEPDGGWPTFYSGGIAAVAANMTNLNGTIQYTDNLLGEIFTTALHPSGGTIFGTYVDVDLDPVGFYAGSFSGNLQSTTTFSTVGIADGQIRSFVD